MRNALPVFAGLLAAAAMFAPAVAQSLKLAPTGGHPTQIVSITGSGFADGEAVDVYVDTVDTLLLVSSSTGTFSGSVTIAASEQPGTHYVTAVGRRSGDAAQAPYDVTTAWNEFGFGTAHLGWNPYENTVNAGNVASLGELWSKATDSGGTTPAVSAGKVFVATLGGLTALSTTTGATLWSKLTTTTFYASPAVSGGTIYISGVTGVFYALSAGTGATSWSTTLGGQVFSSAVVAGGVVYVGCGDGKVYALSASNGHVLWTYATGAAIDASPAVVDGVVYIGSEDTKIYALNATTGALIWSYATGAAVESSPVVANGVLYIGSDDAKVYALLTEGSNVGSMLWNTLTGGNVYATPAVAYGTVYVGSLDGSLYALNGHTGTTRWSYATGSLVRSASVANGVVYVTSETSTLFALDATTGAALATADAGYTFLGAPVISDGVLYVNTLFGNSFAYGLLSNVNAMRRTPIAPDPAMLQRDPGLTVTQ